MNKDKEIFLPIPGYENLYEISNLGRVKSVNKYIVGRPGLLAYRKEKILKPGISPTGYLRCVLCDGKGSKRNISIHRLVLMAFQPENILQESVNHIDGNKLNNKLNNLEWCTVGDNNRHARSTGLNVAKSGKENHSYGLNNKQSLVLKNTETGELKPISEVFGEYPYTRRHVTMMVKGERTNKTTYIISEKP